MNKQVHIIGGGTTYPIRPHLALSAPAYGFTARHLCSLCTHHTGNLDVLLHLTRMAGGNKLLETYDQLKDLITVITARSATKIIFMNAAVVDFRASLLDGPTDEDARLKTSDGEVNLTLLPLPKLLSKIRKERKDIFLVSFKATSGATENEQYLAGLDLLKRSSSNLVLANDMKTRLNMIITPEEARYHVTTDRTEALTNLVEMAYLRSHLTFTRSTVVSGVPVPWASSMVPNSLRTIVDHCISQGAYKPFNGATVGHFAVKVDDKTFLTSRRKTNFNDLKDIGLVKIETDGPDSVIAYGSKPSVGGQSQRIIFSEHSEYNCVVHFHCPIKPGSLVPTVSQREFECGSHECGQNTSTGLKQFGELSAVYLEEHGPNIVFNSSIDPNIVIDFISSNFDLAQKTGGYVT